MTGSALTRFLFCNIALSLAAGVPNTFAYEDDSNFGYSESPPAASFFPTPKRDQLARSPWFQASRWRPFQEALLTLGIPLEANPFLYQFVDQRGLGPEAGRHLTRKQFEQQLQNIDIQGAFRDYLDISESRLSLYRDFFYSSIETDLTEYQTEFKQPDSSNSETTHSTSTDSSELIGDINRIREGILSGRSTNPLQGLRVALDPGHMGGLEWDQRTGKFVRDRARNLRVSEGELNLWTAFLIAAELEALGAEVLITRMGTNPVTTQPITQYDPAPYRNAIIYQGFDSWLSGAFLGAESGIISRLSQAVRSTLDRFDSNRALADQRFYIGGADLSARAEKIQEFNPHLTFDIHFDASQNEVIQNQVNEIKVYVPGGILNQNASGTLLRETGSRLAKALILKHSLEPRRWQGSVAIAGAVARSMSQHLKLPLKKNSSATEFRVVDGVFSRNLYMTLHSIQGMMVYLECFHYDHKKEFYALAKPNRTGTYRGQEFRYPARLEKVAQGVRDGVIQYFSEPTHAGHHASE